MRQVLIYRPFTDIIIGVGVVFSSAGSLSRVHIWDTDGTIHMNAVVHEADMENV